MRFLRQIRVRLMLWYMATIAILVVGTAIFAYARLHRYAEKYADRLLTDEAAEGGAISEERGLRGLLGEVKAESRSRHPMYYTIYDMRGNLVVNTFEEEARPFEKMKADLESEPAFDTETVNGQDLRIVTIAIHGGKADKGMIAARLPRMISAAILGGGPEREQYVMRMGRSIKPEEQMVENLTENLVIFVPGILFISIVVGWALARASLRPMKRLSQEAARITEERLHERLPVRGVGDEIDRHAEVLNKMLAGLESSFAEIKTFAARASHELRTPLTALRLQIESALRSDAAEASATLESALNNLDRLASLVQKLLFLTRARGEASEIKFARLDFSGLVGDVCGDAAILAQQKSQRLKLDIAPRAEVMGEGALLTQMAWNLLDNAIKYSPEGGEISVSVEKESGQAVLAVRDNGSGIAPDDMPHLFEAFYRSNRHAEAPGFGLGLNISKWICELHRGTIRLENNAGKGVTVKAAVPLAPGN